MGSFLAFLIQGIPVVGKLADTFTNYTNKKMDTEIEKLKVNGQVDVSVLQARTTLIAQMKDDPASKWGRRLILYPWGVWFGFVCFRSILQNSPWAEYSWTVAALPSNLEYIGYAIIAYLLGTAWRK